MKAAKSAVSGPFTASRTESFIFARDLKGSWHYTTDLDPLFARAGLDGFDGDELRENANHQQDPARDTDAGADQHSLDLWPSVDTLLVA